MNWATDTILFNISELIVNLLKYMSRHQNAGQNYNLMAANTSFEEVVNFKY